VLILRIGTLSWCICARQNYQSSLSHYGSNPIQNKAEIPTWLELGSYLTERYRTLETVDSFRSANFHHVRSKDTNRAAEFPKKNSFNTRLVPIPKGCDLCLKKNHPVRICPPILQKTVDDRLAYIQRKQLCSNCFASSHQFRDCTSAHNGLTCQDRHHTLLHRALALPSALPLHLSPMSPLCSGALKQFSYQSVQINIYARSVKTPKYPVFFAYRAILGLQLFQRSSSCRIEPL